MTAFMADECFSGPLIRAMRASGYDVVRSADTHPAASDQDVLSLAYSQNRVLLTEDTDFGDLVIRFKLQTRGVIRVDLKALSHDNQCKRLVGALQLLGSAVEGALVTVEPKRTRLRSLQS